ncbi:MAG: GHKL domain-containing protein [Betaproteobacteria bacterium]|nr:GHKL domain-containing protein [Betaproteobacteria bacterium]
MGQLIDDLLAWSRLERDSVRSAPVDVRALIEPLVAERADEVQARGIAVNVAIPFASLNADPHGLATALRNLLENAIKFTRETARPVIEISGRDGVRSCLLWVRDNGTGFDMQYRERIFEIFQRLHRAEDYAGSGVGLAIVRKVIERIGGRVWAESTPGEGATFFLEVPK